MIVRRANRFYCKPIIGRACQSTYVSVYDSKPASPRDVEVLSRKYHHKFQSYTVPHLPNCELFFCTTLHVGNGSTELIKEALKVINPNYLVVQLGLDGIGSILDAADPTAVTEEFRELSLTSSIKKRNIAIFGANVLLQFQNFAEGVVNIPYDEDLRVACEEATRLGISITLGDRQWTVTAQRAFDALTPFERIKLIFTVLKQYLSLTADDVTNYLKNAEKGDPSYYDKLRDYFPHAFLQVIFNERDKYLAQSIYQICDAAFHNPEEPCQPKEGRIMIVLGAEHVEAVKKYLILSPFSQREMIDISSSSKQSSTWHGDGAVQLSAEDR